MRAKIGKPVARIRGGLTIPPQQAFLDRGRFKVLPTTPRATKPPAWRMGSGFDGISLEPSGTMRPRSSRRQDFGHARTHRFVNRSAPKLDFSTESSPSRHLVVEKGNSKRHERRCDPGEVRNNDPTIRSNTVDGASGGGLVQGAAGISGQAASEHVVNVIAPIHHPATENPSSKVRFSSHHDSTVEEPTQAYQYVNTRGRIQTRVTGNPRNRRNENVMAGQKRKRVDFAIPDKG